MRNEENYSSLNLEEKANAMKKGLVLEGGAMRGLFTAGVMDVLMENGVEFDGAVGVSAGAAFGCNYKSRQIGRVLRYNTKYVQDKRYCGFPVLLKTGNYFSTSFCYEEVPLKLDVFDFETFEKNPMEFFVVVTNVETGEAEYHLCGGLAERGFDLIRASASMPLVSKEVLINGKKYLDGGVSDSVPLRFFEKEGYEKNVVVLTQPEGYEKKKNALMPLVRLFYRKRPKLVEAMGTRHIRYNEDLQYVKKREEEGAVLVLRPSAPLPVSRTERKPEKLKAAYELGRKCAAERLPEIKEYLRSE